jgi:amino acid transporter
LFVFPVFAAELTLSIYMDSRVYLFICVVRLRLFPKAEGAYASKLRCPALDIAITT